MPTVLVCSEDHERAGELINIFSNLTGWSAYNLVEVNGKLRSKNEIDNSIDFHFFIYSKELSADSAREIKDLREQMPFVFIVYYYSSLIDAQFMELASLKVDSCIIGVYRKSYLRELIPRLWQSHWKRIPESIYAAETSKLNERSQKILSYIEDHELSNCSIKSIADFLGLSPSHFRSEFRKNLGLNFRDFKQKLFSHYEEVLLIKKGYKPKEVFKLLNYANLANLSRSFRKRHGDNWRNIATGE